MPGEAPEVEELLSALEDGGSSAEAAPAEPEAPKGNPVRELRKFTDTLLKEKKASDSKVTALEERLAKYEAAEHAAVFGEFQLTEKQQAAFKALNPEAAVTREAVQEFVRELGLGQVEAEVDAPVTDQSTPTAPSLPSIPVTGSVPDSQVYSSDDIIKLIMGGNAEKAHEIVTRATRNPNLIQFKNADKMPA